MAESQVLVPLTGTVVIRDGKRVRPEIGKAFSYTASELADLKRGGAKFRTAQNEAPAEAVPATEGKIPPSVAEASQAKARGGKKAATANTADKEAAGEDDDL